MVCPFVDVDGHCSTISLLQQEDIALFVLHSIDPFAAEPVVGMSPRMQPFFNRFDPIAHTLARELDAFYWTCQREIDIQKSSARQRMFHDLFNNRKNKLFDSFVVRYLEIRAGECNS